MTPKNQLLDTLLMLTSDFLNAYLEKVLPLIQLGRIAQNIQEGLSFPEALQRLDVGKGEEPVPEEIIFLHSLVTLKLFLFLCQADGGLERWLSVLAHPIEEMIIQSGEVFDQVKDPEVKIKAERILADWRMMVSKFHGDSGNTGQGVN